MKKYLFGILFLIVVLTGTSFAQDRRADFFSSEPDTTEIPNLIGHWVLDGNAIDSSGNGNHGTVVGDVAVSISGDYYEFDGDGDYIDLGLDTTPKTKYTKSVWVKTSTAAALNIYSGSQNEVLYLNNGQILLSNTWHDNSKNVDVNATYDDNVWHNIVAVYNGTDGLIYMDGVFLNSGPMDDIPANTRSFLGPFSSGYYYTGSMDEVRLYDRALSSTEIGMLYDAGRGGNDLPPVGPVCGDGTCDAGEDSTNCPADCPVGPVCGDGTCDAGEDSTNCPADCPVGPVCGDGTCDAGENSTSCPADCSVVAAGAHYVDNAVSSSGDGSSWNNAWKSFADINWSQINPGDVIYISGGTSSKTYNEKLVVRASGTSGNQITITKGVDAGHNGQVMFDGTGLGGTEAIYIRPSSCYGYVTISNLHFRNWGMTIYVSGSSGASYSSAGAARGIIIENNNVRIDGRCGVFIQTSNNITVRDNHLETPNWVNTQTDGIYSQKNHQNLYENNTIIINNQEPSGHDDCIQMSNFDTDITIRGNYLEQNNAKTSNAQGIMAEKLNGTIRIHNNILNLKSSSNVFNFVGSGEDAAVVEFIGNSIHTKTPNNVFVIQDFDNPVVKNNIAIVTGNSRGPLRIITRDEPSIDYNPSLISNNLLWNANTNDISEIYGLGALTQSELESRGINRGGLNEDPQFKDPENGDFTFLNNKMCTASDTGSHIGALPCK